MRLYIQLKIVKRFNIEDWILVFSVVCLFPMTIVTYAFMKDRYEALDVILKGAKSTLVSEVIRESSMISKMDDIVTAMWWPILFGVKLAYLAFFYKLIDRVKNLKVWWYCVLGLIVRIPLSVEFCLQPPD